ALVRIAELLEQRFRGGRLGERGRELRRHLDGARFGILAERDGDDVAYPLADALADVLADEEHVALAAHAHERAAVALAVDGGDDRHALPAEYPLDIERHVHVRAAHAAALDRGGELVPFRHAEIVHAGDV